MDKGIVIEKIRGAFFKEESEHEACGYDTGCILYSTTFERKVSKILKKYLSANGIRRTKT